MDAPVPTSKPTLHELIANIDQTLSELSSLPHRPNLTNSTEDAPTRGQQTTTATFASPSSIKPILHPHLHLNRFGYPKYTKRRCAKLPDGRIVDENWKNPRETQVWKPSKGFSSTWTTSSDSESSDVHTKPQVTPQHKVETQHIEEVNSASVSHTPNEDQSTCTKTSPHPGPLADNNKRTQIAGNPVSLTTSYIANGQREPIGSKQRIKPVVFPRGYEMPYIPQHLRLRVKSKKGHPPPDAPVLTLGAADVQAATTNIGLSSSTAQKGKTVSFEEAAVIMPQRDTTSDTSAGQYRLYELTFGEAKATAGSNAPKPSTPIDSMIHTADSYESSSPSQAVPSSQSLKSSITSNSVPPQEKGDPSKPCSLRSVLKTPQKSMLGERLLPPPPVSTIIIKPGRFYNVTTHAKDKSLNSSSEKTATKEVVDDGRKQDALQNGPKSRTNKWPKIPKGKAVNPRTDWNGGWDLPAPQDSDPNDICHLIDWKGDWLPPPEWETRGRFSDHNEIKKWAAWIDKTEDALHNDMNINVTYSGSEITVSRCAVDLDHESYTTGVCEVTPRYWIPERIEAQSLQQFWNSFTHSSEPPSFEETEEEPPSLPQWTPYWLRFSKDGLQFIEPLPVPVYSMDSTDECYHVYETDHGSMHKKPIHFMIPPEERTTRKKRRPKAHAPPTGFYTDAIHLLPQIDDFPLSIHKLKVNCYLRVAKPSDDKQMTDIYNHYASNTVHVPERDPRTVDQIRARREESHKNHFKCIVAVEKMTRWRDTAGRQCRPSMSSMEEKVIGFAMADDFTASNSMYRYTSEMEVFVHHEYHQQGVGTALLDRMVFLLDPDHKISSTAEWREKDVELVNAGATRWVKNITISVPFAFEREDDRIRWMESWLKQFGFEKKGEWDRVGIKLNSWYATYCPTMAVALKFYRSNPDNNCRVSLRLFQKRTGSTIDPFTAI